MAGSRLTGSSSKTTRGIGPTSGDPSMQALHPLDPCSGSDAQNSTKHFYERRRLTISQGEARFFHGSSRDEEFDRFH